MIRPGGLTDGPGGAGLVFGQGDTHIPGGGRSIDRADVARCVLESIAVGPRNTTFEVVGVAPAPAPTTGGAGAAPATPVAPVAGAVTAEAIARRLRELAPDAATP